MRFICPEHKQYALAFCPSESCQRNRFICLDCTIHNPENHSHHKKQIFKLDQNYNSAFDFRNCLTSIVHQNQIDIDKLRSDFDLIIINFSRYFENATQKIFIKSEQFNLQNEQVQSTELNGIIKEINFQFQEFSSNKLTYSQFNNNYIKNISIINNYQNIFESNYEKEKRDSLFTNMQEEMQEVVQNFEQEFNKLFKLKIEKNELEEIISQRFPLEYKNQRVKVFDEIDLFDQTGKMFSINVWDKYDFKILNEVNKLIQQYDLKNISFQINLHKKYLNNAVIQDICQYLKVLNSLQSICIPMHDSKITDTGFFYLFSTLKTFTQLTFLSLDMDNNNNISIESMSVLSEVLMNNRENLKQLFLTFGCTCYTNNKLQISPLFQEIPNLLKLNSLYVDLQNNQLDDQDAFLICQALKTKHDISLCSILLGKNKIGNTGAKEIVKQTAEMKNLRWVALGFEKNKIDDFMKVQIKKDYENNVKSTYKKELWI